MATSASHYSNNPEWLLQLVRSQMSNTVPGNAPHIGKALTAPALNDLTEIQLDDPFFMDRVPRNLRTSMESLKSRAALLTEVFGTQYAGQFTHDLIPDYIRVKLDKMEQGPKVNGSPIQDSVGSYDRHKLAARKEQGEYAGNAAVMVALKAFQDMSLADYLHHEGELTQAERDYAFAEINGMLSAIGLNSMDALLEMRPDLDEALLKNDDDIKIGSTRVSRGEYYAKEKATASKLASEGELPNYSRCRNKAIGGKKLQELDFDINDEIPAHPVSYAHANLDGIQARIDAETASAQDMNTYFTLSSFPQAHPERTIYADRLRSRMAGANRSTAEARELEASTSEASEKHAEPIEIENPVSEPQPNKDVEKATTPSKEKAESSPSEKPEKPKGNKAAAITTISAGTACGVLLASKGRSKDKEKSNTLRFVAAATAAVAAVGAAIVWSKKPEALAKTIEGGIKHLLDGAQKGRA